MSHNAREKLLYTSNLEKIRIREETLIPSLGNFCALGRAQKFTLIIAVPRILNKRKISLHRQKSLVRNLEVWKFRSFVFTYKNIKKLILLFYYIPIDTFPRLKNVNSKKKDLLMGANPFLSAVPRAGLEPA